MKKFMVLAGALMLLALPTRSYAQFGVQASWGSDSDFGIGARLQFALPATRTSVEVILSGDYFFPSCGSTDCSWIEFNANGAVNLKSQSLHPYVGGGLNVTRVSVDTGPSGNDVSDTKVGINILGGLKFPVATMTPFAEARFTISGSEQFVLTGGILFGKRR